MIPNAAVIFSASCAGHHRRTGAGPARLSHRLNKFGFTGERLYAAAREQPVRKE
jgi:hypothetical protein